MKRILLTPLFKRFKKSVFFLSLNQNTCPVKVAKEIQKQEQKEAISIKKGVSHAQYKS